MLLRLPNETADMNETNSKKETPSNAEMLKVREPYAIKRLHTDTYMIATAKRYTLMHLHVRREMCWFVLNQLAGLTIFSFYFQKEKSKLFPYIVKTFRLPSNVLLRFGCLLKSLWICSVCVFKMIDFKVTDTLKLLPKWIEHLLFWTKRTWQQRTKIKWIFMKWTKMKTTAIVMAM